MHMYMYEIRYQKQKKISFRNITWSEMGKQNSVQAKEVNWQEFHILDTMFLKDRLNFNMGGSPTVVEDWEFSLV